MFWAPIHTMFIPPLCFWSFCCFIWNVFFLLFYVYSYLTHTLTLTLSLSSLVQDSFIVNLLILWTMFHCQVPVGHKGSCRRFGRQNWKQQSLYLESCQWLEAVKTDAKMPAVSSLLSCFLTLLPALLPNFLPYWLTAAPGWPTTSCSAVSS